MNIDEMEAGRKLDALIADRLFNLIRNGGRGVSPHDPRTGITRDVDLPLARYSTDIAAAWAVVREIIGRAKPLQPWGDSTRHFEVSYLSDGWRARIHENHWNWPFGPKDEPGIDVTVEKEATAPLAICKVALKALAARSTAR